MPHSTQKNKEKKCIQRCSSREDSGWPEESGSSNSCTNTRVFSVTISSGGGTKKKFGQKSILTFGASLLLLRFWTRAARDKGGNDSKSGAERAALTKAVRGLWTTLSQGPGQVQVLNRSVDDPLVWRPVVGVDDLVLVSDPPPLHAQVKRPACLSHGSPACLHASGAPEPDGITHLPLQI